MRLWFFNLIVSAALALAATPALALSLYQIGNSLTWDSKPAGIAALATQGGHSLATGYHLKSASSLKTIYENPTITNIPLTSFGRFPEALPNYEWDFVVLQSALNASHTMGDDLDNYLNFVDLARSNPANADTKFYIYTSWPWQTDWGPWDSPVVDSLSTIIDPRRQYYEHLAERVSQGLGEHVPLIPVGEVLKRIDEEARAGNMPGLSTVADLYRDIPHLNVQGSYVAGLTVYTTLFGEDPRGQSAPAEWNLAGVTAQRIAQFQEIVWDVVGNHPYSGVVAPRTGDYDSDGDVDGDDQAIWQDAVDNNLPLNADANGDRVVDQSDRNFWQWSFGLHQTSFRGDYNGDDQVDAQDFEFWKANYGSSLAAVDGNLDGKVTAADYTVWRDSQASYDASWRADFSGDGAVDEDDLAVWELEEGLAWDLAPDLNGDLIVDELDLAILQENFYDPSPKYRGDFNGDGFADETDFGIWKADYGKYFTLRADANNDGRISAADYTVWRDHRSSNTGFGALTVVPEPTSLVIFCSAILCVSALTGWPMLSRGRQAK